MKLFESTETICLPLDRATAQAVLEALSFSCGGANYDCERTQDGLLFKPEIVPTPFRRPHLPRVRCDFTGTGDKTQVKLTFFMPVFVRVFCAVYVALALILTAVTAFLAPTPLMALIPLALALLGLALPYAIGVPYAQTIYREAFLPLEGGNA